MKIRIMRTVEELESGFQNSDADALIFVFQKDASRIFWNKGCDFPLFLYGYNDQLQRVDLAYLPSVTAGIVKVGIKGKYIVEVKNGGKDVIAWVVKELDKLEKEGKQKTSIFNRIKNFGRKKKAYDFINRFLIVVTQSGNVYIDPEARFHDDIHDKYKGSDREMGWDETKLADGQTFVDLMMEDGRLKYGDSFYGTSPEWFDGISADGYYANLVWGEYNKYLGKYSVQKFQNNPPISCSGCGHLTENIGQQRGFYCAGNFWSNEEKQCKKTSSRVAEVKRLNG